jgi:CheY-like chemotaxis protein
MGVCVLIVEDDDDFRGMLSELLVSMGHRVLEAADVNQALECGQSSNWDVAIIDLHLPGVDGCEVARRLRTCPQGRTQRLIALTGFSDVATRAAARVAGFDAFVVKPVFPEQLSELLQR